MVFRKCFDALSLQNWKSRIQKCAKYEIPYSAVLLPSVQCWLTVRNPIQCTVLEAENIKIFLENHHIFLFSIFLMTLNKQIVWIYRSFQTRLKTSKTPYKPKSCSHTQKFDFFYSSKGKYYYDIRNWIQKSTILHKLAFPLSTGVIPMDARGYAVLKINCRRSHIPKLICGSYYPQFLELNPWLRIMLRCICATLSDY